MGRESRGEHARRWAADTVKRQAQLSLTDSCLDLFRDVGRIDDNNVSANRLKLGRELGRRTMLTVFKPRAFANAITHRPTDELAEFCTTHSPGFRLTYSLSSSAAVGGLMASIDNCPGSAP